MVKKTVTYAISDCLDLRPSLDCSFVPMQTLEVVVMPQVITFQLPFVEESCIQVLALGSIKCCGYLGNDQQTEDLSLCLLESQIANTSGEDESSTYSYHHYCIMKETIIYSQGTFFDELCELLWSWSHICKVLKDGKSTSPYFRIVIIKVTLYAEKSK